MKVNCPAKSQIGFHNEVFCFKPRALLSWQATDASQFRLRIERTVGQLDFNNFIASSNFSQNGVNAGNENLKPDQHWQFEGDYEYHFWERGAFLLSITRDYATNEDRLQGPLYWLAAERGFQLTVAGAGF